MSLRAELQQFVDAAKAAAADGSVTTDDIHEIIRQAVDCLAPLIDALEPGNDAAVQTLVNEAIEAATEAVNALPDGRWLPRQAVLAGVRVGVPWLVEAVAQVGQPAHGWIQEYVVPRLENWEQTIHRTRVALGG